MKKFVLAALIIFGILYAYYWYVRGVNLLIRQDDLELPPYAIAQRLPPKDTKGKPPAKPAPVAETVFHWKGATPMLSPRSDVGSAAIGTRIYIVGGVDGFARTTAAVEAFDTELNVWMLAKPMPKAAHHVAVAAYGGKLYAFGGLTGLALTPVDTLYIYDPLRDQWTKGADLPDAVGASVAVVAGTKIHLLGGKSIGADVDSHYVYDPAKNSWDSAPEMISGREQFGAAFVDGKIYIFGGRQGGVLYNSDVVERYDLERKAWDPMENMPLKRSGFVTLERQGKIYLFGGEGPTVSFDQVDVYDPKTDHWQTLTERMPSARHGLGGAMVDGSFFLIGGGKRTGLSVSDANEVLQPVTNP